jgi:DUF438 domain-containing protein
MKRESAKDKVINICELLSTIYPSLPDDRIQEAAIDLHDIERSCQEIAQLISNLRSKDMSAADVLNTLEGIELELVDHICRVHLNTLRTFIKSCHSDQPVENSDHLVAKTQDKDVQDRWNNWLKWKEEINTRISNALKFAEDCEPNDKEEIHRKVKELEEEMKNIEATSRREKIVHCSPASRWIKTSWNALRGHSG